MRKDGFKRHRCVAHKLGAAGHVWHCRERGQHHTHHLPPRCASTASKLPPSTDSNSPQYTSGWIHVLSSSSASRKSIAAALQGRGYPVRDARSPNPRTTSTRASRHAPAVSCLAGIKAPADHLCLLEKNPAVARPRVQHAQRAAIEARDALRVRRLAAKTRERSGVGKDRQRARAGAPRCRGGHERQISELEEAHDIQRM